MEITTPCGSPTRRVISAAKAADSIPSQQQKEEEFSDEAANRTSASGVKQNSLSNVRSAWRSQ